MTSYVDPTREAFGQFRSMQREGAIHMLNLIRLREKAEYADGREATGAEAYEAYSRECAAIFSRMGGHIAWRGGFEQMLIGPEEERWDVCFIAEYPSVDTFVTMVKDPEYQKAVIHRKAAVAESRLIRLEPQATGAGFAS